MSASKHEQLDWIKNQRAEMIELVELWAAINSGSENLEGLGKMLTALKQSFAVLGGDLKEIPLPPRLTIDSHGHPQKIASGKALHIRKHPQAPIQVFLGGHMDTVYSPHSPFQKAERLDATKMRGPGVADMKGGLVVMLKALEKSTLAGKIGWEVLINPDEEVGSPSSEHLFEEAAKRNHLALLYEPAFPDGSLVSSRKGSMNFTLVVKGRSAHAGRDFFAGRSAVSALVKFISAAENMIDEQQGITVNIGKIEGGQAANIVPDFAFCKLNVRMKDPNNFQKVAKNLEALAHECSGQEGIHMELTQTAARAPKLFNEQDERLFNDFQNCARTLGIALEAKPSGGVCDGNILSAAGVPTIDTLGVVGGSIHTYDEYLLLDSLVERASLSTLFLLKIAAG